jgi:hypothetical protein
VSKRLLALAAFAAASVSAQAAVQLTDGNLSYSQSFDSLASSGTSNAWTNDSTLLGWSLFNTAGTAITSYRAGTGSATNGAFYSFGLDGDRALGGLGSSSLTGYIAVAFTNSSSNALDSFTLTFDGEQWRNGGNATAPAQVQTMNLQYGFGTNFADVTTWNSAGASFNWTAPVTTLSSAAAVDGNNAGRVGNVGGTVSGLSWSTGQTLWIRWIEENNSGNDHGLAIDNVALSVTSAVPEPSSYALMLAGLAAVGTIVRRRRQR